MVIARILFTKSFSPYRKGETAGFLPDTAKKYVDAKFACYVDMDNNKIEEPELISINNSGIPENEPTGLDLTHDPDENE